VSALKAWRRGRREESYWAAARRRSETLPRGEVVSQIDLAIMSAGRAVTYYRHAATGEEQDTQLHELRLHLEAALGMLDNVLPS